MSEFVEYLTELFREFGEVKAKRMFGGHGLYHEGLMFGLVADDTLYLKVDEETVGQFEIRGLEAFQYERNGKAFSMSYHLAPDEMMENPKVAAEWAQRSYEAALRSKSHPKGRKR